MVTKDQFFSNRTSNPEVKKDNFSSGSWLNKKEFLFSISKYSKEKYLLSWNANLALRSKEEKSLSSSNWKFPFKSIFFLSHRQLIKIGSGRSWRMNLFSFIESKNPTSLLPKDLVSPKVNEANDDCWDLSQRRPSCNWFLFKFA